MKAEQRKELETNTLADRMGQVMQKVKGGTRRSLFIYLGVGAAVLFAAWFAYRWYVTDKQEASWRWVNFHDGAAGRIVELAKKDDEVGKAALFQIAWFRYWEEGVKSLGADQRGAILSLQQAGKDYESLAKRCKDDPVFEPQAMLGRAVVAESLAIQDRDGLKEAKKLYEELVNHDKYGEKAEGKMTAEAKFAKERLDILNDTKKGEELGQAYARLGSLLRIDRAQRQDVLPFDLPKKN